MSLSVINCESIGTTCKRKQQLFETWRKTIENITVDMLATEVLPKFLSVRSMANSLQILHVIFAVLFFIAVSLFNIHAISHYYCSKTDDDQPPKKINKCTMILSVISLSSWTLCMAICILAALPHIILIDLLIVNIFHFTKSMLFHISVALVYLLFLNNLHIAFRNTAYNYSLCIKLTLLIFVVLQSRYYDIFFFSYDIFFFSFYFFENALHLHFSN